MLFGSLLQTTLKEKGIPVSRFADSIGLNRVAVYSVFNGKKKISEDTFERILKTYNFSPEEETELFRAFRLSSFSREKLELMEFIRKEIVFIGKSPNCILPERMPLDLSKDSIVLSSKADYYSAIEALLKRESENGRSTVYTNYSFFDEAADKIIFDFVNCENCPLSIRHTIVKGTENNIKERLRNGFASIKFAKRGHYTDVAEPDEPTFAFPTHFVGENATIMYDPKTENGFFTTKPSIVKAYYISAAKRDSKRPPFNRFIENPFELKNIMEPLMLSTHVIFESHMPLCFFTDREILDDTLKQDIPHREMVLSAFWSHLLVCHQMTMPIIFVRSAIKDFVKSGKSFEAPDLYLNRISVPNRKKILLEAKERITEKNSNVLIADDSRLEIDEIVEVYNFDRCTMVAFVIDKPDCDFMGSGSFTVNASSFLPLLNDFYDYLIVNDCLLSKEEAAKAFDEGIAICDEMIAKGIE